jgi:hypothetical protein
MSSPANFEAAYKLRRERRLNNIERYKNQIVKYETKMKDLTDKSQIHVKKKGKQRMPD